MWGLLQPRRRDFNQSSQGLPGSDSLQPPQDLYEGPLQPCALTPVLHRPGFPPAANCFVEGIQQLPHGQTQLQNNMVLPATVHTGVSTDHRHAFWQSTAAAQHSVAQHGSAHALPPSTAASQHGAVQHGTAYALRPSTAQHSVRHRHEQRQQHVSGWQQSCTASAAQELTDTHLFSNEQMTANVPKPAQMPAKVQVPGHRIGNARDRADPHAMGYSKAADQYAKLGCLQHMPAALPVQQSQHCNAGGHELMRASMLGSQVSNQAARQQPHLHEQASAHQQPAGRHMHTYNGGTAQAGGCESHVTDGFGALHSMLSTAQHGQGCSQDPQEASKQTADTSLSAMEAVLADYKALRAQILAAEYQLSALQAAAAQPGQNVASDAVTLDSSSRSGYGAAQTRQAQVVAATQCLEELKQAAVRQRPLIEAVALQLRNRLLYL